MNVFIVMKNGQPAHVTACEQEATSRFDETVEDGEFETASMMVVATSVDNTKVLRKARLNA